MFFGTGKSREIGARKKAWQRATAIFFVFVFILVDALRYAPQVYACSTATAADPAAASFSIPKELGKIDEVYFADRMAEGGRRLPAGQAGMTDDAKLKTEGSTPSSILHPLSSKTIVFIQDAHDSLEAQENIAKLISKFVKEKGIKTVFEEGYEGPVPTDKFFGFIKDPAIKQKVSYFLLDRLRIGGAEYAHINRKNPGSGWRMADGGWRKAGFASSTLLPPDLDWRLVGVEDLKLYGENLKCYQESSKNRKDISEDLGELYGQITTLANQYFPKELKSLLKRKELFSEGKLPLLSYLRELRGFYPKVPRRYSAEEFTAMYPAISILLRAQTTKGPKLVKQLNALDARVVFDEITQLEKDISSNFLQVDRDHEIFAYYQGLSLLKRLNRIELTQAEYEAAREVLKKFETQKLVNFIVSLTRRSLVLSKEWEQHIQDAIRFYDVAQGRDQAIDKHLREFIQSKEEDTAILVFGGFHANGIKEILRQQGLSYVVISPRITSMNKRHQDYYKRLMSEGHHSFEIPFLAARANKPPSIFFTAAVAGQETSTQSELRAIVSSVEINSDPQLIERYLTDFIQTQQTPSSKSSTTAVGVRSEMRNEGIPEANTARSERERERIAASFKALSSVQRFARVLFVIPMYSAPGKPGELQRLLPKSVENPLGENALRVKVAQFVSQNVSNPNFLWKILAVDDGTPELGCKILVEKLWRDIIREYADKGVVLNPDQVRVLEVSPEEKQRTGSRKGYAVVKAMKQAVAEGWAEFIGYTDTDISTNVEQTPLLLEKLMKGGADVAIGSRWLAGGEANVVLRSRFFSSKLFNLVIKTLLPPLLPIVDTQRGFKLFTRDILSIILKYEHDPGMSFDTELLLLTKLAGGKIKEVPISWFDSSEASTVALKEEAKRMVKGILMYQCPHLFDIGLRWKLTHEKALLDRSRAVTRSEARNVGLDEFEREDAKAWIVRDLRTGAEKGLAYQTPLVPGGPKDLAKEWRDFHAMVFTFPKLLERAAQEKLPVVLVLPEQLDGFGPLASEAPWIEGARTALAWASAYFRFKELGNVDVRVLRLPGTRVSQDRIAEAVKELSARKIRDDASTPEKQMEARMFRLEDVLKMRRAPIAKLSLEVRALSEIVGLEKAAITPEMRLNLVDSSTSQPASNVGRRAEMIRPDLPPVPKEKKRIVITGAAGFIGTNLVKRLLAEGHQVVALDNLISANKGFRSFFQDEPNLYFKQWDVSEPFDIEGPVDQVLHMASLASPPDYYGRPRETLRAGLQATREVVELARRKKARFLFTSTSEVYGDAKVHPQPETYAGNVSPFLKRSQYDQSKRGAETLLKLYSERYASEGLNLRMMRIFNTYGPYMRIDDGRVITNFIEKVLTGEPIEIYGNENITRSFGYVEDTVEGLLKVLRTEHLDPALPLDKRVFNIGNDSEFTLGELANLTNALGKKYLGREVPVHIVEVKDPSDPTRRRPDLTRARAVLNYAPSIFLAEGLEKTFLYFLNSRSEARMIEPEERRVLDEKFQTVANFLSSREAYVPGSGISPKDQWVPVEIGKAKFSKQEKILVMILGTWEEKVALEAAPVILDLRARGYDVKVLTSGKYGNKPGVFFDARRNRLPEAVHYRNVLEAKGVTVDFVEPDSTNSGDNIRFSVEKLNAAGYKPATIIVMQNRLLQKRAGLSIVRQYFGIKDEKEAKERFDTSGIRLISYAPYLPDITQEDDEALLRDLEYAVTEVKNLQDYPGPGKGYSIPTVIPQDVLDSAKLLMDFGAKIRQRIALDTFKTNYQDPLRKIAEYPDPAGVAKILRGMELKDGHYQGRVMEPGAFAMAHEIPANQQIIQDAKKEFREFMGGLREIFGEDGTRIQAWEQDDAAYHIAFGVFQDHKQLMDRPVTEMSVEEKAGIKALVSDRLRSEPGPIQMLRAGYGVTADGGFVMFLVDPSGRTQSLQEFLLKRANDLTDGKVSGRPKRGHVTLGRVLKLPYSDDASLRKKQQNEVLEYVRQKALRYEGEWEKNLKKPLTYTISNISIFQENEWLSFRNINGQKPEGISLGVPPVAVTTFEAKNYTFGLTLAESSFQAPEGRFHGSKVRFDRLRNHDNITAQETFGEEEKPWKDDRKPVEGLKQLWKDKRPEEIVAFMPNGNLGMNDSFVGIVNGQVFYYRTDDLLERDGSGRLRSYDMLVAMKNGEMGVRSLRFDKKGDRILDEEGEDISDAIAFGVFGQHIVRDGKFFIDGKVVDPKVVQQFDDLRHLLRFPMFVDEQGRQTHHGFSDEVGELYTDRRREKVRKALAGESVDLDLASLSSSERENLPNVFRLWGYENAGGWKDEKTLKPGEYLIKNGKMWIVFKPGIHPHSFFGLTQDNKIFVGAIPAGLTQYFGLTLGELSNYLIKEYKAKDLFLWGNGKDNFLEWQEGTSSKTVKAQGAYGKGYSAFVVTKKPARSEVRNIPSFKEILAYQGIVKGVSDPRKWKLSELDKKYYAEMSPWDAEKFGSELCAFFKEGILVPLNDTSLFQIRSGEEFLKRFIDHLIHGAEKDGMKTPGAGMSHYWVPANYSSGSVMAWAITQRYSKRKFEEQRSRYRALLIRLVEHWDQLAAQSTKRSEMRAAKDQPKQFEGEPRLWRDVSAVAEAAVRLAGYIHDNDFKAILASGDSADIPLELVQTAWAARYPGQPLPARFIFNGKENNDLYREWAGVRIDGNEDASTRRNLSNRARKLLEGKVSSDGRWRLTDLKEEKIVFIDSIIIGGFKTGMLKMIFGEAGYKKMSYAVLATANAKVVRLLHPDVFVAEPDSKKMRALWSLDQALSKIRKNESKAQSLDPTEISQSLAAIKQEIVRISENRSEARVVDRDVEGKWLLPGVTVQQERFERVAEMPEEYHPVLHVNINGKAYSIGHGDYLSLMLPSGKKIYWGGQHNLSYAFFFKHFNEQANDRLGSILWRHAGQRSDLNIGSLYMESPPKNASQQRQIDFGLQTLDATNYLGFIQSRKLARVEHVATSEQIDGWDQSPEKGGILDIDLDILVDLYTAKLQDGKVFSEKLAKAAKTAEVIFITNSSELQAVYPGGESRPGFPKYLHPDEAIKFGIEVVKEIARQDGLRSEVRAASENKKEIISGEAKLDLKAPVGADVHAGVASVAKARADRMVRSIRQNNQPATVFVDAEDFKSLSLAQKQEYLVVALSNKALHVVVYNERGQMQDKELDALLKLDRVTRTGKDLAGAQSSFDRSNAPSIHLSKKILPSQELVQRLRKRVSFFKTQGQNGGTLAAALLWVWSGGEDARLREISQGRDGFWIVAETLVNALQKSYDSTLAFTIAA